MANIYDVANELSRTLRDLPEYKAVVESKQAIEANPEAKTLFDEYVAFQQQLSIYLADLEKIIFEPIQDLYK